MSFHDEVLEGYFIRLGSKAEAYGRAYWLHLKGQGPQPKPEDYGITSNQGQAVRIKLAGYR
jgi:hypothetical protein